MTEAAVISKGQITIPAEIIPVQSVVQSADAHSRSQHDGVVARDLHLVHTKRESHRTHPTGNATTDAYRFLIRQYRPSWFIPHEQYAVRRTAVALDLPAYNQV